MFRKCRHILPSGARCRAAAVRDKPYCYFHDNINRQRLSKSGAPTPGDGKDASFEVPLLEDTSAVSVALTQVLNAIAAKRLEPRHAGQLLYGLQIAASLTTRGNSLAALIAEKNLIYQEDGQVLAEEDEDECEDDDDEEYEDDDENGDECGDEAEETCKRLDDCVDCPHRDNCTDFKLALLKLAGLENEHQLNLNRPASQ